MNAGSLRTSVFGKDTYTDGVLNFRSERADNAKAMVTLIHVLDRIETRHFVPDNIVPLVTSAAQHTVIMVIDEGHDFIAGLEKSEPLVATCA